MSFLVQERKCAEAVSVKTMIKKKKKQQESPKAHTTAMQVELTLQKSLSRAPEDSGSMLVKAERQNVVLHRKGTETACSCTGQQAGLDTQGQNSTWDSESPLHLSGGLWHLIMQQRRIYDT